MAIGRLILCATPIGNLEDMAPRALRALAEADVLACEDTRRTRRLLTHFGISVSELAVYNETNERRQVPSLISRIERGETVVLVSDAGMPGLSDPGYRLVAACAANNLRVEVIPGPNAAVSALVISALPPGRFVFEGFLPRRSSERRRHIMELRDEPRTLVLYESPHRVASALEDLAEILGARPAALVRELTKMYEEVRRGTLPELLDSVRSAPPKGEIVLVISGSVGEHRRAAAPSELARRARELMDSGVSRPQALKLVARDQGVAKREVFDALLEDQPD